MPRYIISALVCVLAVLTPRAETVGLTLSGGGAKGIAHIGFIQALEENEIPIDYITGTSMGAIVGSLYAIGYSPAEMMQLLASKGFAEWSTGRIADSDRYLYSTPGPRPDWVSVNFAPSDSTMMAGMLPTRLINPLPMSFAFMELYAPANGGARADFNRLMVPFRCVASDIYRHKAVVFSGGQLADAVRASMSFPLVFQPIMVGDTLLYDGGLYDVYPVDVMMNDFNPDRLIGVDVSTPNTPPGLNNLVGQIENMIMSGYMAPFPNDRGVNVVLDLSRFGLLDWGAAAEIYSIGYRRGRELADSLRSRITARRPVAEVARRRAAFRSRLPELRFDSLSVSGSTPGKDDYIRRVFTGPHRLPGDTLTVDEARRGFYRVASSGRMRNLVPHATFDSITGLYSLSLKADVDKDYHLGIGGYLTSSPGSMIYVGARWNRYSMHSPDAGIEAWLGQSYMAARLSGSQRLATPIPSQLSAAFTVQRERFFESEKMFYDFTAPAFISSTTVSGEVSWRLATGYHSVLTASITGAHVADSYHRWLDSGADATRERLSTALGSLTAKWERSTLDDVIFPSSGHSLTTRATGLIGRTKVTSELQAYPARRNGWADLAVTTRNYFPLAPRFSLGIEAAARWSTLPLQPTYESSIVRAPAFTPVPTSLELYDPGFRANQWLAATLVPVVKLSSMIHIRATASLFAPLRRILPAPGGAARYGAWFGSTEFLGDLSAIITLPFATVRLYGTYRTTEASRWSAGIGIGLPLRAPSLIR